MLFKAEMLQRIAKGEVDLAFRRWRRPSVKAGGRLRTPAGVLGIKAVEIVADGQIAGRDAERAGFEDIAELERSLDRGDGELYRIELAPLREDERVALRQADRLSEADCRALLSRWDESRSTGYGLALIEAIAGGEAVPAKTIAERLGTPKDVLKRDVRVLKELGLTESLVVGYRLSPRGSALHRRMVEEGR